MIGDKEVIAAVEATTAATVTAIQRAPYEYATSFVLERFDVALDDGRRLDLILKDLTFERLLTDARRSKPRFLYEPRREIDTYRCVLPAVDAGPACYGTGDSWFLIEKVPGVELWQIGDIAVWEGAARWLADFHRRGAAIDAGALNRHLLCFSADFLAGWPKRAVDAVDDRRLQQIAARYDEVIDRLTAGTPTFVHGEFYPSNVLVDDGGHVWPVDWEMAAIGPPLLDVAALTTGWDDATASRLVAAYGAGSASAETLDCCRLHLALQWIGWSDAWSPPAEHARDWLAEAAAAATRLGLMA